MIYRGFGIENDDLLGWIWYDEHGRIHTGKIDTKGGFKSEEDCLNDIDRYRRETKGAMH